MYPLLKPGSAIITFPLIISLDTLSYFKLEERTKWEWVFRCLLTAEFVVVLAIEIHKDELYTKNTIIIISLDIS